MSDDSPSEAHDRPATGDGEASGVARYSAILECALPMEAGCPDVGVLAGGAVVGLKLQGRTRPSRADQNHWVHDYDALGRVTAGKRLWADGTPVTGQQFEYTYDDIGNRRSGRGGGNEPGTTLRSVGHTAYRLNECTARRRVSWDCDPAGRRIPQVVSTNWTGSGYAGTTETRYVYDGWLSVAGLNASNNLRWQYGWGVDPSGTTAGAGAVGGLLWVRSAAAPGHFVAYDGNGNVVGLADGSTGVPSARYEYDAFGNSVRLTGSGSVARDNPSRFSTKRAEVNTGLVRYVYRACAPSLANWLNRDPIGEKGGANLYAFVRNAPANAIDPYGQESWVPTPNEKLWRCAPCGPLSLVYDLDDTSGLDRFGDWVNEPTGTKWINNLPGILQDIKSRTQSGKCCVNSLTLTAHNGNPGILPLGTGMTISVDSLNALDAAIQRGNPKEIAIRKQQEDVLGSIGGFMCKPSKITFAMCESGAGEGGARIQQYLKGVFGPDVEIVMFATKCKWSLGNLAPVP